MISDAMLRAPKDPFGVQFPRRFQVLEPPPGDRIVVEELDNGVCRHISEAGVASAILSYCKDQLASLPELLLTWKDALGVKDFWKADTTPIEEPAVVLELSQPGRTYHRLAFDVVDTNVGLDKCPLFAELFSRMTNGLAVRAWIGSLFDKHADRQQYVWLFGQGRNGKSALARVLQDCFGPAYSSEYPREKGDKFWTSGLLGKRLVVFPDCNDYVFPSTGFFKSLTGGDAVRIERKKEQPFTAKISAKFMFLSNEKPAISSEAADVRRIIYAHIGAFEGDADPRYELRLREELPAFIATCVNDYTTICPRRGTIPVDDEAGVADVVAGNEERFAAIFEDNFEAVPKSDCSTFIHFLPYLRPSRVLEIFDLFGIKSPREIHNFKAWMERQFGISLKRVRLPNSDSFENRYVLIREKHDSKAKRLEAERSGRSRAGFWNGAHERSGDDKEKHAP